MGTTHRVFEPGVGERLKYKRKKGTTNEKRIKRLLSTIEEVEELTFSENLSRAKDVETYETKTDGSESTSGGESLAERRKKCRQEEAELHKQNRQQDDERRLAVRLDTQIVLEEGKKMLTTVKEMLRRMEREAAQVKAAREHEERITFQQGLQRELARERKKFERKKQDRKEFCMLLKKNIAWKRHGYWQSKLNIELKKAVAQKGLKRELVLEKNKHEERKQKRKAFYSCLKQELAWERHGYLKIKLCVEVKERARQIEESTKQGRKELEAQNDANGSTKQRWPPAELVFLIWYPVKEDKAFEPWKKQHGRKQQWKNVETDPGGFYASRERAPSTETSRQGVLDPREHFGRWERPPSWQKSLRKGMLDPCDYFGRRERAPSNRTGEHDPRDYFGRRERAPSRRKGKRDPRAYFGRRERAPSTAKQTKKILKEKHNHGRIDERALLLDTG
jgi:hypothetical protein